MSTPDGLAHSRGELPRDEVVLVDEHDRERGTEDKLRAHVTGELHRAVSVMVFRGDGCVLLQRRAAVKYHSAGLWSNACCGHPRPGEEPLAAAHRRLREEMGLECPLEPAFTFVYRAAVGGGLVEHELDHVFVGRCDAEPVPNAEEVDAFAWVTAVDMAREVASHPERYTAWLPLLLAAMRAHGH